MDWRAAADFPLTRRPEGGVSVNMACLRRGGDGMVMHTLQTVVGVIVCVLLLSIKNQGDYYSLREGRLQIFVVISPATRKIDRKGTRLVQHLKFRY
jgi:hypothetical protein